MKSVRKHLALLNMKGKMAFSPLLLHQCLTEGELPDSYAFWKEYCRFFIRVCEETYVLTLPGWEISTGVSDEIQYSQEIGRPVSYILP